MALSAEERLNRARATVISKLLNTYGHALVAGAVVKPFFGSEHVGHLDWAFSVLLAGVGFGLHGVAVYLVPIPAAGDDDDDD